MALADAQLDAIEAVKGKRNPALWDSRCEQYLEKNSTPKTIKTVSNPEKG